MSIESDLLRMLEPAVRPGNLPAPSRQVTQPIEQQSFDDLLRQAAGVDGESAATAERIASLDGIDGDPADATQLGAAQSDETARGATIGKPADLLGSLGGVGHVENESLREVLAANKRSPEASQ